MLELARGGGGGCSAFGCAVGDRCSSKSIHECCKLYRMKKAMLELARGEAGGCSAFGCAVSDRCSSKSMNECSKFACYLLQAVLELARGGGGRCSAFGCAVGDRCSSKSMNACCKLHVNQYRLCWSLREGEVEVAPRLDAL